VSVCNFKRRLTTAKTEEGTRSNVTRRSEPASFTLSWALCMSIFSRRGEPVATRPSTAGGVAGCRVSGRLARRGWQPHPGRDVEGCRRRAHSSIFHIWPRGADAGATPIHGPNGGGPGNRELETPPSRTGSARPESAGRCPRGQWARGPMRAHIRSPGRRGRTALLARRTKTWGIWKWSRIEWLEKDDLAESRGGKVGARELGVAVGSRWRWWQNR